MRVHLEKLRCLLVEVEYALPLNIRERRQPTHQRTPVGHRKARTRQSCDAAKNNHRKHKSTANQKPDRDSAILGEGRVRVVHL